MNKQILLIDDDEDEQFIFQEALKEVSATAKCIGALTADDALKILQSLLPDFIFLDINMPVINGFECLELIKNHTDFNSIPVVIYSTGVNDSVYNKALKKGAVACIKKQNSIQALANVLKIFLF